MAELAHARHNDPETSHAAARSVGDLTAGQRAVLAIIRLIEPCTDEHLVTAYNARHRALGLPRQSASGIRSRRAELARAGKLTEGERAKLSTGRLGRTWRVAT